MHPIGTWLRCSRCARQTRQDGLFLLPVNSCISRTRPAILWRMLFFCAYCLILFWFILRSLVLISSYVLFFNIRSVALRNIDNVSHTDDKREFKLTSNVPMTKTGFYDAVCRAPTQSIRYAERSDEDVSAFLLELLLYWNGGSRYNSIVIVTTVLLIQNTSIFHRHYNHNQLVTSGCQCSRRFCRSQSSQASSKCAATWKWKWSDTNPYHAILHLNESAHALIRLNLHVLLQLTYKCMLMISIPEDIVHSWLWLHAQWLDSHSKSTIEEHWVLTLHDRQPRQIDTLQYPIILVYLWCVHCGMWSNGCQSGWSAYWEMAVWSMS